MTPTISAPDLDQIRLEIRGRIEANENENARLRLMLNASEPRRAAAAGTGGQPKRRKPPAAKKGAKVAVGRPAAEVKATILAALADGPLMLGKLVERVGVNQASVSKCLRDLRDASKVERVEEGWRLRS